LAGLISDVVAFVTM